MRTITRLLSITSSFYALDARIDTLLWALFDRSRFNLVSSRFRHSDSDINAFVNTLVLEIEKEEKVPYRIVDTDWIILMEGLEQDLYAGFLFSFTHT